MNTYIKKIKSGKKSVSDMISNFDFYKYISKQLPIVLSSELHTYAIEDLVDNPFEASVILIENPQVNHWVLINKFGNEIQYFDSYGVPLENGDIKFYKEAIVPKFKLTSNKIPYQKLANNINTCGPHVLMRLLTLIEYKFDLKKHHRFMKELSKHFKEDYDNLVTMFVPLD